MRARAAVLHEVKKPLAVEDVDLMEPGPHEVLVRWVANGVCHSDLHVMTGDYPHPLPVVLGHEAAGVVEKVGPGVETVAAGDHVCSSYIPSCGRCAYCIGGQPTMCALRDKPRWFMHDGTSRLRSRDGVPLHVFLQVAGYATHAVLPEPSVIPIRRSVAIVVQHVRGPDDAMPHIRITEGRRHGLVPCVVVASLLVVGRFADAHDVGHHSVHSLVDISGCRLRHNPQPWSSRLCRRIFWRK